MKIAIVSFKTIDYENEKFEEAQLKRAGSEAGHEIDIYYAKFFSMGLSQNGLWLKYNGKVFDTPDVAIARADLCNNHLIKASLLSQFELMNIPIFNKAHDILVAKSKISAFQLLIANKMPIIKTIIVNSKSDLADSVKELGGFPIILKDPISSLGNGVHIFESMRSLQSVLSWAEIPFYYLQEYVRFTNGSDVRVLIVGGKVIGAMKRTAQKGEFRSNIHMGGTGQKVELSEKEEKIAIKAAKVLGLHYAGVDILRSKNESFVIEVNPNTGFKGFMTFTGIDVAKAIIKYAEKLVKTKKR